MVNSRAAKRRKRRKNGNGETGKSAKNKGVNLEPPKPLRAKRGSLIIIAGNQE